MKNKSKILVLFDFDGTITYKDSMIEFIKFSIGKTKFYFGLIILSPLLLLYKMNIIANDIAKQKLITYFYKGYDKESFLKIADRYSLKEIDKIVYPKSLQKIKWHQSKNHHIVIVTASIENWVKGWCDRNQFDLIATQLEVKENKITGKFSTKNCYGLEKVNRIKQKYNLSEYDLIYAYGNGRGDKEMLEIADKSYFKHFNF